MFTGKESRLRKQKRLPGGKIKKPIFVYIYIFFLNNIGFLTFIQRQQTPRNAQNLSCFFICFDSNNTRFQCHLTDSFLCSCDIIFACFHSESVLLLNLKQEKVSGCGILVKISRFGGLICN